MLAQSPTGEQHAGIIRPQSSHHHRQHAASSAAALQRYRYRPQPRWNKPSFLSNEDWSELLQQTWRYTANHEDWRHLLCLKQEISVDEEWTNFMHILRQNYMQATTLALARANNKQQQAEINKALRQAGCNNGKGTRPPLLQPFISNAINAAGCVRSGLADRKLAKQVARRHEVRRLAGRAIQLQGAHYLHECSNQLRSLTPKIWPQHDSRNTTLGFLLRHGEAEIKQLQANHQKQESDRQKQRLDQWKSNMQSANIKNVSRWLHHKENPSTSVDITHNDNVADNNITAADYIYQHWQNLWQQLAPLDTDTIAHRMATNFNLGAPQATAETNWQPPDLATFTAAVLDADGSAGCDSWSSTETRYMPIEAIRHFL